MDTPRPSPRTNRTRRVPLAGWDAHPARWQPLPLRPGAGQRCAAPPTARPAPPAPQPLPAPPAPSTARSHAPPFPPPRTKRTSLVPPLVLSGHASSLTHAAPLTRGRAAGGNPLTSLAFRVRDASGAVSPLATATLHYQCPAGQYVDQPDRKCRPCPSGQIAPATGLQALCGVCPAGTFAASAAASTCTACAAGTFAPTPGATPPPSY